MALNTKFLTLPPQVESLVRSALEKFNVPGAAVGIWTPNEHWVRTFGQADVARERAPELAEAARERAELARDRAGDLATTARKESKKARKEVKKQRRRLN